MLNTGVRKLAITGIAASAFGVFATAAEAKTYKATYTDETGDGPAPGRDITEVKVRYKSNGSVLFAITTAGPIDGAGADAGVGISLGSTCKKLLGIGGGAFSQPDPVFFARVQGKKLGKEREGKGEITGNVYTLSIKHSSFKNWKPGCFAVALVDPATAEDEAPVPFDQIGEVKIKG